jgi:hypothetical protein
MKHLFLFAISATIALTGVTIAKPSTKITSPKAKKPTTSLPLKAKSKAKVRPSSIKPKKLEGVSPTRNPQQTYIDEAEVNCYGALSNALLLKTEVYNWMKARQVWAKAVENGETNTSLMQTLKPDSPETLTAYRTINARILDLQLQANALSSIKNVPVSLADIDEGYSRFAQEVETPISLFQTGLKTGDANQFKDGFVFLDKALTYLTEANRVLQRRKKDLSAGKKYVSG